MIYHRKGLSTEKCFALLNEDLGLFFEHDCYDGSCVTTMMGHFPVLQRTAVRYHMSKA